MMLGVVLSLLVAQSSDASTPPMQAPGGAWVEDTPSSPNERRLWRNDSTFSILELDVYPGSGLSSEYAAKEIEDAQAVKHGAVHLDGGPITLCGRQGYWVSYQGTVGGTSFTWKTVVLSTPAAAYVVEYQRPTSLSDDAGALAAQASLCPAEPAATPTPQPSPTPARSVLPLSEFTFVKPPPGWIFSPTSLFAVWTKDSSATSEVFGAGAGSGSSLSSKRRALAALNLQKGLQNATYITGASKQLCGYQAFETWVTWQRGSDRWIEVSVFLTTPKKSYSASYERLANLPEDPAAMTALDSLCPPAARRK